MQGSYIRHRLNFSFKASTSRGVLEEKLVYIIKITDSDDRLCGLGECAPLAGLSIDDLDTIEEKLKVCMEQLAEKALPETPVEVYRLSEELAGRTYPALRFGFEMALLDLLHGGMRILFRNSFYLAQSQIPINGLIWMGSEREMLNQGKEKIDAGFRCIKMKVGAIDFDTELRVLETLRSGFEEADLILRVDANGAFPADDALDYLKKLAPLDIHSIEQPIKPGNEIEMARLCRNTPVPVALDEELIGRSADKRKLLSSIRPQYIVLKPTLLGGFMETLEWITLANDMNIGWWITSALESNVGLNAIAQFTFEVDNGMVHGLGTGGLYTNNIASPLKIVEGNLVYLDKNRWNYSVLGDFLTG